MRWRPIPANPVLTPSILRLRSQAPIPSPLDRPSAHFFAYARVALLEGLKLLDIHAGDNVLVPSLICRAALAPFHALSIGIRFYPVGNQFEPDFEYAGKLVDKRTRAFLAVHYFGFPQDVEAIRRFCQIHRIWFIEDNAHGFLSALGREPLGTFGDIAIFSFRKTLPLPDGAALLINNPSLPVFSSDSNNRDISHLNQSKHYLTFFLRNLVRNLERPFGIPVAYTIKAIQRAINLPIHRADSCHSEEDDYELSSYLSPWSSVSKAIVKHMNWEKVKATRILAFHFWRRYFQENRTAANLIFPELPEGTVPYAFPLTVEKRHKWIEGMAKQGIECFPWPDLPSNSPERFFAERLAAIPLHMVP
jgi:hypothetical protein